MVVAGDGEVEATFSIILCLTSSTISASIARGCFDKLVCGGLDKGGGFPCAGPGRDSDTAAIITSEVQWSRFPTEGRPGDSNEPRRKGRSGGVCLVVTRLGGEIRTTSRVWKLEKRRVGGGREGRSGGGVRGTREIIIEFESRKSSAVGSSYWWLESRSQGNVLGGGLGWCMRQN
jgi:hypothetical protein